VDELVISPVLVNLYVDEGLLPSFICSVYVYLLHLTMFTFCVYLLTFNQISVMCTVNMFYIKNSLTKETFGAYRRSCFVFNVFVYNEINHAATSISL